MEWRENSLARLEQEIRARESLIVEALRADLGKSEFEAFTTEIGLVLDELKTARREFRTWSAVARVSTPLKFFPARSEVHMAPKGAVLILAPWNYPFQLAMAPLVAAVASGNSVVLKVSEFAPQTGRVIAELTRRVWPDGEVVTIEGDAEVAAQILDRRWDHVFFTGGTEIGRKVMQTCAKYLTPVTLELGGKSPCVVDRDVDIEVASRRILWGKSVNTGQTCIAPDYLVVHADVRDALVSAMKERSREFFGERPLQSKWLGKIVSEKHFARLSSMLDGAQVLWGGDRDGESRKFAPTLVSVESPEHPLLKEEIFGPILPVITWSNRAELDLILQRHPRPLAFYIFTKNSALAKDLMTMNDFGGGCVNDTLLHVANGEMPFGGVGESGMGAYHGQYGFETFSHRKSVMTRSFVFDLKFRYPPYPEFWKKLKGFLE